MLKIPYKAFSRKIIENIFSFLLERLIYPIILSLKKKNFKIPEDTQRYNIIRKNSFVNCVCYSADLTCAILIICGWSQNILTYIGLMTIAMYIFADHFKIYCKQYKMLCNEEYMCLIRKKTCKRFKKYTPNLWYVCITAFIFLVFLILTIVEGLQHYSGIYTPLYKSLVLFVLLYMMMIKLKYYFLDTFEIDETVFVIKELAQGEWSHE